MYDRQTRSIDRDTSFLDDEGIISRIVGNSTQKWSIRSFLEKYDFSYCIDMPTDEVSVDTISDP